MASTPSIISPIMILSLLLMVIHVPSNDMNQHRLNHPFFSKMSYMSMVFHVIFFPSIPSLLPSHFFPFSLCILRNVFKMEDCENGHGLFK